MYREKFPRTHRRRAADPAAEMMNMVNDWNEQVYGPYIDAWQEMMAPWTEALRVPDVLIARQPKRHHKHDECSRCGRDDCHCECCVHDADLAIYTRVGEQRVVPILIENSRRRERQVKLELSSFSTHDKTKVSINGRILEPTSFTIAPCEEKSVILIVQALPQQSDNQMNMAMFERVVDEKAAEEAGRDAASRIDVPDVSECTTYYADLRVEGCDMRPIRIAVVVLPRGCDPFEIDCHCGCC